jgi:hypothetical protein
MKPPLVLLISLLCGSLSCLAQDSPAGPVYHEALSEFTNMKTTLYQHKTEVNRETGSYKYDCVEFVSYALRHATPVAWESICRARGLAKGRVPSPPSYQKFFASLWETPQPGWEAVRSVKELLPGDLVSWDYKTERATGHAVVIASLPKQISEDSWEVQVYDSTSTPHGGDSRPADERAHIYEVTGRRSGLGTGTMALTADPATGTLTGYRWTSKGKVILCPIGAGRPRE